MAFPLPLDGTPSARGLVVSFAEGNVSLDELSEAQRELLLSTIGLDPTQSYTPEQVRTAAVTWLSVTPQAPTITDSSGEAPVDTPDISGATAATQEDPWRQALAELYVRLWGQPAPSRWLENAVNSGKNLFEIELEERSKPAFMHTKVARGEYADYAAQLATALGLR